VPNVGSIGDINSDGLPDVYIHGACVYLHYSSSILASATSGADRAVCSDASIYGVANAGDIDGDGQDDLVVSTTDDTVGVFLAQSLVSAPSTSMMSDADHLLSGNRVQMMAGLGDLDGDGLGELALGSPYNEGRCGSCGRFSVVLGSSLAAAGTSTIALSSADYTVYGDVHDQAGMRVLVAGDVDADGLSDLLIAGMHENSGAMVHLLLGKDVPLMASTTDLRDVVAASISMPSGKSSFQVRGVGDVNGDGYDDIMLGNVDDYTYGTGAGRAHLFYGRQGGLGE